VLPRILQKFCDRTHLPINVSEIEKAIKEVIQIDQINYIPDNFMDASIMRGCADRYSAYDGTMDVMDVYYPALLNDDWKRLVQVKELIHLFDSDEGLADDRISIVKLIADLVTPKEVSALSSPGKEDILALPWAAVDLTAGGTSAVGLRPSPRAFASIDRCSE
jgi:hypothetical protein